MNTRAPRVVVGSPERIEERLLAQAAEVRGAEALAPLDILVGGVLQRPYLQRRIADTTPASSMSAFRRLASSAFGLESCS